jgi:hypothetical protein
MPTKPTVDGSKRDTQRPATYAKGGNTHMHRQQAAGRAKSGQGGAATTVRFTPSRT